MSSARDAICEGVAASLARFGYASVQRCALDALGADGNSDALMESICAVKGWHCEPATLSIGVFLARATLGFGHSTKKRKG